MRRRLVEYSPGGMVTVARLREIELGPISGMPEVAGNVLTNPQRDPHGKLPEFKLAACRVTKEGERVIVAE